MDRTSKGQSFELLGPPECKINERYELLNVSIIDVKSEPLNFVWFIFKVPSLSIFFPLISHRDKIRQVYFKCYLWTQWEQSFQKISSASQASERKI